MLDSIPRGAQDCPVIEYDGGGNGDGHLRSTPSVQLYLRPRCLYSDPSRRPGHFLVLCDVMQPSVPDCTGLAPHASNNRAPSERLLSAAAYLEPSFSVEQQYSLLDSSTLRPLGAFSPYPDSPAPCVTRVLCASASCLHGGFVSRSTSAFRWSDIVKDHSMLIRNPFRVGSSEHRNTCLEGFTPCRAQ